MSTIFFHFFYVCYFLPKTTSGFYSKVTKKLVPHIKDDFLPIKDDFFLIKDDSLLINNNGRNGNPNKRSLRTKVDKTYVRGVPY